MGEWLNVAFIQTADLGRVEHELVTLISERGRRRVYPPDTRLKGRQTWTVHPAHVVRALATEEGSLVWEVVPSAIMTVFGGANSKHCDNMFLAWVLVVHGPMPVGGFVLYADRT